MTLSAPLPEALSFGPFRVYTRQRLVLEDDRPVALGSRAFELLLALLSNPGVLVSKEDLISRVWPDLHVSDNNLRVQVAALRRALGDGRDGRRFISVMAGRGYTFVAPVAVEAPAVEPHPDAALPSWSTRLPGVVTRLVGRDAAIRTIASQLQTRRFVTIVGAGGIGKTTAALAIGRAMADDYPDGAHFVDLSSLRDPALVPGALANALHLNIQSRDPVPALCALLEGRRALLILDNCEHLVDAAAALAEQLFQAATDLHLLATSREPLRAAGECVHRLQPFESPPPGSALSPAQALVYPSVELFVERAASLGPFALTDANAPIVADICHRLDGIALAIELAARRAESLGLSELAAYLDDRFRLLTVGRRTALSRHHTLEATLDWSYQLLAASEQRLFRRLAVCAGPFSLQTAVALVPEAGPAEVAADLAELVSKSLVNVDEEAGGPQLRLFATMRLFGLARLKEAGEADETAHRHAAHILGLLGGPEDRHGSTQAATELLAEIRAALDWAFSPAGKRPLAVAITIAAVPLWVQLSSLAECRSRVEAGLDLLDGSQDVDRRPIMELSAALGWALMYTGGSTDAVSAAWERTLDLAIELGDPVYELRGLWGLWINDLNRGAFRGALQRAQLFAMRASQASDEFDTVMAGRMLGTSLHYLGDQAAAGKELKEALAKMPERPWPASRFQTDQAVTARYFLARVLWLQGYPDQAKRMALHHVGDREAALNPLQYASVLGQGACPVALFSGDGDSAARFGAMLLDHTRRNALTVWETWARCFLGLLRARTGDPAGLDIMRAELSGADANRGLPRYLPLVSEYAQALLAVGDVATAERALAYAMERCEANAERWLLAEFLRVKGEIALTRHGDDGLAEATSLFRQGLDVARSQASLSLELRCALSLARVAERCGAEPSSVDLLRNTYSRFEEGFETADLVEARAVLHRFSA